MALNFSHVALTCTAALIGITAWLAVQGHNEVRGERNDRQFLKEQLQASQKDGSGMMERMNQLENKLRDKDHDRSRLQTENTNLKTETKQLSKEVVNAVNDLPTLPPPTPSATIPAPVETPAPSIPVVGTDAVAGNSTPADKPNSAQKGIASAKAIAKVTAYNQDFSLVELNAGSDIGIAPKHRYSIRRGMYLVGEITIADDVSPNDSVGQFKAASPNALPQAGDEVIPPVAP